MNRRSFVQYLASAITAAAFSLTSIFDPRPDEKEEIWFMGQKLVYVESFEDWPETDNLSYTWKTIGDLEDTWQG